MAKEEKKDPKKDLVSLLEEYDRGIAISQGIKSAEAGTNERAQAQLLEYASKPAFEMFKLQNPGVSEDEIKTRFAGLPAQQRQELLQIGLSTRAGFAYEKAVGYSAKNLTDLVSSAKPAMLELAVSKPFQEYMDELYERDKKAEGIHDDDRQIIAAYAQYRSTKQILKLMEENKKDKKNNNPLRGLDEEQQKQLMGLAVTGAVKLAEDAFKKVTPERRQLAMQLAEKVALFMPGYELYKNAVGKIAKDQEANLEKLSGKDKKYEDRVLGVVSRAFGYGISSGNPDRERKALDLYSMGIGYQPGKDFSKMYPKPKKKEK